MTIESIVEAFKSNNPHVECTRIDNELTVSKPWGYDDCLLKIDEKDPRINFLSNIQIDTRFDAIIHISDQVVEFIFGFLDPNSESDSDIVTRKFTLQLDNNEYTCYYAEPTDALWFISYYHWRLPTDIQSVPQIKAFRDYKRLNELPASIKPNAERFFKDKIPINFFVKIEKGDVLETSLSSLTQSINFLMKYYDRDTPIIHMREEKCNILQKNLRYISDAKFPSSLSLNKVDDLLLQWMSKAYISSARQQFLFFYQILEYCSFYFLDKNVKDQIQKVIKEPTFVGCSYESLNKIIDIIKEDYSRNDESKIIHTVTECIDTTIVWSELHNDVEFFSKPINFVGGLEVGPMIHETRNQSKSNIKDIKDVLTAIVKVRNCIVHAREKRETIAIVPCNTNDMLLRKIIPVLQRIAEQVILYSRN